MAHSPIQVAPGDQDGIKVAPTELAPEPSLNGSGAEAPEPAAPSGPWPLLLLKTMRPKQWTKNAVVFAALVFSFRFRDLEAIALTVAAFVLFCLLSSAVYIMNDLADRERDRMHPRKRFRPLASGALSPSIAVAALVVILIG